MRVISAFPATGKSYLAERASEVVDPDSSAFSWKWSGPDVRERHPDWPANYLVRIRSELDAGRTVVVSTHAEVRDALVSAGVYFVLAYPDRSLRAEYRERMTRRGSPSMLIEKVIGMWDEALDQLQAQHGCDHLVLGAGRYLADLFVCE